MTEASFAGGHDLIVGKISVPVPTEPVSEFTFRDFRHLDVAAFQEYLWKCDWIIFNSRSPLEQAVSTLYEHLFNAIDMHVPIKPIKHFRRVGDATHESIENARLNYYANSVKYI